MIETRDILLMASGVLLGAVADSLMRAYLKQGEKRDHQQAKDFIASRGYSAHIYFPSLGVEDPELRRALDRAAVGGRIIVDSKGAIVGNLLAPEEKKGPQLRLVVDNTTREM